MFSVKIVLVTMKNYRILTNVKENYLLSINYLYDKYNHAFHKTYKINIFFLVIK